MSIKEFNEKSINFLAKLYIKVLEKKICWDVMANKNQFSSTIKDKYKISIIAYYSDDGGVEYSFNLYDKEGNVVFGIESSECGSEKLQIDKENILLTEVLKNIYGMARASALDLDKKVDDALNILDSIDADLNNKNSSKSGSDEREKPDK